MSHALRSSIALTFATGALALGVAPNALGAAPADNPTVWGCLPGTTPDPCDGPLTTTYLSSTTLQPRKVAKVETPAREADPGVDCFYVYPTVSGALTENAPKRIAPEIKAIYHFQAARFSQVCKVYAPIYRQASLFGILAPVAGGAPTDGQAKPAKAFDLAYRDVLDAWNDYLANYNHGRGVVLIGHSQGSGMLIRLMREEIDARPELRAKLVSAIVPGGNLTVAAGQRTGGDLNAIPTCAAAAETGCAIAYSSYANRPARSSLFGRASSSLRSSTGIPTRPGTEVACVNPAELSGDAGRFETYARSESFPGVIGFALNILYYGLPPKAGTPWVSPGERYTGRCRNAGGANVLMIRAANAATIVPIESPTPDWGLHLADINLPLGNLVRVVARQANAYTAAHPAD